MCPGCPGPEDQVTVLQRLQRATARWVDRVVRPVPSCRLEPPASHEPGAGLSFPAHRHRPADTLVCHADQAGAVGRVGQVWPTRPCRTRVTLTRHGALAQFSAIGPACWLGRWSGFAWSMTLPAAPTTARRGASAIHRSVASSSRSSASLADALQLSNGPCVDGSPRSRISSMGMRCSDWNSSALYSVMSLIGPMYTARIVSAIRMRVGTMRWVNFSKVTLALSGRPCTVICGEKTTVMSRG